MYPLGLVLGGEGYPRQDQGLICYAAGGKTLAVTQYNCLVGMLEICHFHNSSHPATFLRAATIEYWQEKHKLPQNEKKQISL